jgi:hypothetical protein
MIPLELEEGDWENRGERVVVAGRLDRRDWWVSIKPKITTKGRYLSRKSYKWFGFCQLVKPVNERSRCRTQGYPFCAASWITRYMPETTRASLSKSILSGVSEGR